MDFFDYSPAASGMTYRNNRPRRRAIDGVPETVATGNMVWETVDGPQGGLSIVTARHDRPRPDLDPSYYLDEQTPSGGAETQCTGDARLRIEWALDQPGHPEHGPAVPRSTPSSTRTLFFELPGKADGPKRAPQVDRPMEIQVIPHD